LLGTIVESDTTVTGKDQLPPLDGFDGGLTPDEAGQLFELYRALPLTDTPPDYVSSMVQSGRADLPSDLSALLVVRENSTPA
jgi:hypothetical protein